jgi:hypothetical protein
MRWADCTFEDDTYFETLVQCYGLTCRAYEEKRRREELKELVLYIYHHYVLCSQIYT